MADTTLNQLTDAEIRDNPNRIAEYLANNFRAFIQPEAQGGKRTGIWVGQKKFEDHALNMEMRDKLSLGILLLIFLYAGKITDLHVEVQGGGVCHIKGRKNQLLLPITVSNLFQLYDYLQNTMKITLPFSDKILRYIRDILGKEELIFDLTNPYEAPVYDFVMEAIMSFSGQSYTGTVFYKNMSKNVTVHLSGTKLPYRNEFVPQTLEGKKYYSLVTRLLVIKLIKPDYGAYEQLIETMASGKGTFLICGKTNSGKSSTAFSLLDSEHTKNPNKAFFAVEDPVEKALDFVTHFETWVNPQNPEETMTFGDYLKSIVRLDGDYVFLGEMRDAETIMNATQLASIGYSIYSTMHVGSVFALKSRVEKYGVEFPSLAESLKGVIVQELLPEYDEVSCKYLKDFTDADIETQLPIIREIWRYGKGISTEPSPMLSRFHRKVMKFKPLINNNLVYSEDKHPGFKRLKDSLETYDTFVKFLYDAFKTDVNKAIPGTKGMKLVFEVLPVDDENRDAYASGDKNSVYGTETAFIPHFINGMILFQDTGVSLKDLLRLSGNY